MQAPTLAIIVPTFNESANIPLLITKISKVLKDNEWEIIFVDDNSPDGTITTIRQLAQKNPHVRGLLRVGRRGLSGAVIEGLLSSSAPYLAVMDADLQHDEKILPTMLNILQSNQAQLAIGSRFTAGASTGEFSKLRTLGSRICIRLTQLLVGVQVADPMTGYFMLKRETFQSIAPRLSTEGFKILLDILVSSPKTLKVKEVPFTFGKRQHGESKMETLMALDLAGLVLSKLTRNLIPVRFVLFLAVGFSGLAVHLATLKFGLNAGLSFPLAQTAATITAMTSNFLLNNSLTYRSQRLKGLKLLQGLLLAYVFWSIGGLANVGVASWIYTQHTTWWLAGAAGAFMGAVFNYATSNLFIWKTK